MNRRKRVSFAFVLGFAATPAFAAAPTAWNLELPRGRNAKSGVTVTNRCRAPHAFRLTKAAELPWLTFLSSTDVQIPPGAAVEVPVRIDAAGLDPGDSEGDLSVKCLDCVSEPTCSQDLDLFRVRLKVLWAEEDLKNSEQEDYLPQELLVVLDAGAAGTRAATRELEKLYGLKAQRTFDLASISRAVLVFRVPAADTPVPPLIARVQRDQRVRLAQPNFLYRVAQARRNDPDAERQYGLRQLRADEAHRFSTGKGVRIAVLDSHIDAKHSDLAGALEDQADFFSERAAIPTETHGTLMTGVIGARADNGVGIYGIAPEASLLAVRVCGARSPRANEQCSSESIARGLDFAIGKGARVVNLSLAGPYDPLLARLVREAAARRMVLVAAAGNDGPKGKPRYPAALEDVLAVSGIDSEDRLYESANRGGHIDLAASGVGILSTTPRSTFGLTTGTSIAAAQVTGVVALLLQVKPEMSPAEVRSLLEETARDLGANGKDELFGSGAVDACRAIEKLTGGAGTCP